MATRSAGARCPTELRYLRPLELSLNVPALLGWLDSVKNPTDRHFVPAGVAVFEHQIYLISKFDAFVTSLN